MQSMRRVEEAIMGLRGLRSVRHSLLAGRGRTGSSVVAALVSIVVLGFSAPQAGATPVEGLNVVEGLNPPPWGAGSEENSIGWFFKPTEPGGFTGDVVITIPAGFSAPQKKPSIHGYARVNFPHIKRSRCEALPGYKRALYIAGSGPWTMTLHLHCAGGLFKVAYHDVVAPDEPGEYFFDTAVTTEAGTESLKLSVPVS
jgi:hypothetical protein